MRPILINQCICHLMICIRQQKKVKNHRRNSEENRLLFELFLDLIKIVLTLQQHSSKITQMDQIHSNAGKQLEMQSMQQQNTIDRESP